MSKINSYDEITRKKELNVEYIRETIKDRLNLPAPRYEDNGKYNIGYAELLSLFNENDNIGVKKLLLCFLWLPEESKTILRTNIYVINAITRYIQYILYGLFVSCKNVNNICILIRDCINVAMFYKSDDDFMF